MSTATTNEIERLRQERDALQEQLSAAIEREAALAAHVERIKAEEERAYSGGLSMPWLLHDIIHQSPATNLARRDLIKQAEALELVNCQSGPQEDTPQEDAFDAGWNAAFELIRQFASELRQRASEL